MSAKYLFSLLLAGLACASWAKPAPWYWWLSKLDGSRVCRQVSPGPGWYRSGPPYRNARCDKPTRPR